MDVAHRLGKVLMQFNDIRLTTLQRLLDFFVESWVDMNFSKLKLFHDRFQRVQPARELLWGIRKSFDETVLVLFSEEANDKRFQ